MSKKLYHILITIAFGIISIPTVLNIIFQERILNNFVDKAFLKLILIIFICMIEVSYIKRKFPKTIGYILWFVLLIGMLFKIQHWPFATELVMIAGLLLFINLVLQAINDKNKGFLHYLLLLFVLQRLLIILTPTNEILWWIDVIICFVITIFGLLKVLNLKSFKR
ncbi:hypothetical protein [uncultured Kordia sp.]|uniref:hypothetical protein n=1 Tax=uncultured Kordia sp. TaxID=507699 RepID=UPI00262ED201|nr:hypothetical protein [uncultured Kordia sp.]